jgi:hypothetical protein
MMTTYLKVQRQISGKEHKHENHIPVQWNSLDITSTNEMYEINIMNNRIVWQHSWERVNQRIKLFSRFKNIGEIHSHKQLSFCTRHDKPQRLSFGF